MLPFTAIPITSPTPIIGIFKEIVSQDIVNAADSKRTQPVSKFADLVVTALSDSVDPYDHIYQTFYFELPNATYVEMQNISCLKFSGIATGLMVKGVLSGSFTNWLNFLQDATLPEQSIYLRTFANMVYNCLKGFPPFNLLSFKNFNDKTMGLVLYDS